MNLSLLPFGDCGTAILHSIGSVQSHGVLVAIQAESQVVEYCSANSAGLLGIEAPKLLGQTGVQWQADRWPGLATLAGREGILEWAEIGGTEPLVVVGHRCGPHLILEFERRGVGSPHWWNHAARTAFLAQLTAVHTAEQCREFLVNQVFTQSGYDRVMMYRFLPDWSGEVALERCRPGIEGFLGLRFPATDIPPNARQLFALNWQRAIADVDSETAAILSRSDGAQPLDLTYSTLRAAHPAHIQYLKNMGVQASLTLSTVVNGKLWGLIACHHLSTRSLSIEDRLSFEEMARLVSLHLTNLLGLMEQNLQSEMRQKLSALQGAMSLAGDDARLALSHNLGAIRQVFGAGGAWLRFEGLDVFHGLVPDKLSLAPLRDFLERFPRDEVSSWDALPEALQPYRALAANASGMLFIPLSGADFIALLQPEVISTINWAGKPADAETQEGIPAQPLTPRNSFAVWSQRMRNISEAWTPTELGFAGKLRTDLQLFIGNARLEQIALHDPLTGLANRLLFDRRLQQEVRNAIARNTTFAVHMIDLDRFKHVNDTLGHGAGDQVLTQVAERLMGVVRKEDTVARLGGDEFAIIQTGLADRAGAVSTADKIVNSISEPYRIDGEKVEIGASVGISLCPADTVEEDELMECADLALYEVKHTGRSAYSMYLPTMRTAESRITDGDLLVNALRDNEFELNYQPIVDAHSGELRGLEAFLRWRRPGEPIQTASEFLPLAEQRHLGPAVGKWVMNAVFAQYQQWMREGLPPVPITVNIGASEFATLDLPGDIEALAARYETGWQWLRLDIKEEALMADPAQAVRKLNKLRDAGVGANLDNFGRGFVPLGYLTQLPFRGIKVDAVLFDHKRDRTRFNALLNVVQGIAQVFSAQLTVTRIETVAMRDRLRNQRIDLLQGYSIARPAEAAKTAEWLRGPERLLG
ncbi:MAG: EAL domain-containing protein [Bryobacteraceae bacterium]